MSEEKPEPRPVEWTKALALAIGDPRAHELPLSDPSSLESPWVHPPSGVRFMRDWRRVRALGCMRYDELGHDVSVRYVLAGAIAVTTYVFPLSLPDLEASRDVSFFNAVRDMLGSLDDPRAGEEVDVAFAVPGHAPLRGRRVRAVGTPRGSRASRTVAVVEMFVRDGWAVKRRSTATPRREHLADELFERWLFTSRFGGAR